MAELVAGRARFGLALLGRPAEGGGGTMRLLLEFLDPLLERSDELAQLGEVRTVGAFGIERRRSGRHV
jgi:hypothetical protein